MNINRYLFGQRSSVSPEQKARQELEAAQKKAATQREIARLKHEKAVLEKQVYDAQLATQKAQQAAREARIASGNLTFQEQAEKFVRGIKKTAQPSKRRVVKRTTTARKPTATRAVASKGKTVAKKSTTKRKR